MPAFIFAIFLSAFLLFQVQPIIARYILPWYGGSPAVWTTCMLCFQVGLLAGYFYAHLLVSKFRKKPKTQVIIHLALLVLSFIVLPITPSESLKPTGNENPTAGIVLLVLTTVGLPYIVISASGPLLQSWFGLASGGKSPYRLYAVSNLGSLLGLLSYPFLFEPNLGLHEQTNLWSGGYVIYGLLAAACGWVLWKFYRVSDLENETSAEKKAEIEEEKAPPPKPRIFDRLLWVLFAASGSVALLAITNQMCQDVSVVPFLWVLPLSLYLITFIIAFDASRWYYRPVWLPLLALSVGLLVFLINQDFSDDHDIHIAFQIGIFCLALFACCMVCHGEMVRLKPHPHYLTSFYLAVSLGGALGGLFVSLVAPLIFDAYHELHTILLVIALLVSWVVVRDLMTKYRKPEWVFVFAGIAVTGLCFLVWGLHKHIDIQKAGAISMKRSFYGVLIVDDINSDEEEHIRQLYHGRISHGRQFMDERWSNWPITYYGEGSGPDTVFRYHPSRTGIKRKPMKFGVVGLGVGTMAAFAQKGDTARFYEINSQVEDLAREHFSYLKQCEGTAEVILGDARIMLEQELATGDIQKYDALFVDAFSGDSIPVHLLTEEAFELYFKHLKDDGALMIHITNRHLDLSDPVRVLAAKHGCEAHLVMNNPEKFYFNFSEWILITKNKKLIEDADFAGQLSIWNKEKPDPVHWTDDYSNLVDVVMWEDLEASFSNLFGK